jgi:opacity protein-like surface antigen
MRILALARGACVAITIAVCLPALAAPAGLGLGAHGGYGQSVDAESGSLIAGAHAVLNPTTWLGVVASVDYKFEEHHSVEENEYSVESYPLTLTARVYFPTQTFSPYIAAGVQYRIIKYGGDLFEDVELDDSEDAFGWVAGAGAVVNPGDDYEVFGEVLYELNDPERDLGDAVEDAGDFKYDQWSVRVGFTFFLN